MATTFPVAETGLKSVITGEVPHHHNQAKLWVQIDITSSEITYHCREVEHTGSPKGTVLFDANAACTIKIEDTAVIKPELISLVNGKKGRFTGTGRIVGAGTTMFNVQGDDGAMAQTRGLSASGPKVVVPLATAGSNVVVQENRSGPKIVVP